MAEVGQKEPLKKMRKREREIERERERPIERQTPRAIGAKTRNQESKERHRHRVG